MPSRTFTSPADARSQWISYLPFISKGMRSSCTPEHTVIETLDGKQIRIEKIPALPLTVITVESPWDDLNLAYFSGYAMWNYLNTTFHLWATRIQGGRNPGLEECGETRRRLRVIFPDYIATHCSEQIFHVNGDA